MLQTRCLATTAVLLVNIGCPGVSIAATLNVPTDYPTIQACIDAAASGVDECVVAPGTYHEIIDFLGKGITLRSSGGRDVTTIDATGIGGSVVTCDTSEGRDTILDGFTITGGTQTFDWWRKLSLGGGMHCNHSSPTVTNCTFNGNTGNGMFNHVSSPAVVRCRFSANKVSVGGGMFNGFSAPLVTNCMFSGNAASGGGGMYNENSTPTLTACTFIGNTANYGGGMLNDSSSPTVTNCTFGRNTANDLAGGMYNYYYSSPMVTNCIVWGDSQVEIVNEPDSAPTIRFSNVQGGLPVGAADGGGNIVLDPMFVRPPNPGPDGMWDGVDDDYGDLRLQAGSPCINAGDPDFVAQPGETDLEGHARVLCGRVDMGAYEFGIGDYDCDQAIDLTDFADWAGCMTGSSTADTAVALNIGCETFDFDGDADVDFRDFAAWQNAFAGE